MRWRRRRRSAATAAAAAAAEGSARTPLLALAASWWLAPRLCRAAAVVAAQQGPRPLADHRGPGHGEVQVEIRSAGPLLRSESARTMTARRALVEERIVVRAPVEERFVVRLDRDEEMPPPFPAELVQDGDEEEGDAEGGRLSGEEGARGRQGDFPPTCKDMNSTMTGFEVHGEPMGDGGDTFLRRASCSDLKSHCHNTSYSEKVRSVCPVACLLCDPRQEKPHVMCHDMGFTGIKFKGGRRAKCEELVNYCNHSTYYMEVQKACRLSCGMCVAEMSFGTEGCNDLLKTDPPEFVVAQVLAGCTDLRDFCAGHVDSVLIRRKCPLTCKLCRGNETAFGYTPMEKYMTTSKEVTYEYNADPGGCQRRRRYGFCTTRRRRNL